ncbi:MAG: hypothetical protein KAF41_06580, partial [Flavobacterium sp.]|nr:hypothetical protein [Flavobacterium sp.]
IVNKDYKIYSAGISYLFSTKNINAKNLETKEDFILDSKPYFDTFINAFKDGEKYFKDKFEVSKEVLYGNNSKTIVADIHQNYFHIAHSDSFTGWVGVIHSNPMLITHEIIKKYGFYSGILSKADAFISEYPNVFIDFHKCSNESTKDENQNVSLESILKKQNNLLPKVSIQDVYNHFNILTTSTNKNNQFYLTNEQLLTFILSTFVEQKPIKQNFNCDGIIKKEVRKVFYDFYFKNKNKETNQTKLKRKYFNIMNNAFNGFNENDYTDFAK